MSRCAAGAVELSGLRPRSLGRWHVHQTKIEDQRRRPTRVTFGIWLSLWRRNRASLIQRITVKVSRDGPHKITKPTCGGTDGEIHLGVYDEDLGWPGSSDEFSFPVGVERIAWGLVVEPPNVTDGDATFLEDLEDTPATFDGYCGCGTRGTGTMKTR